VFATKSLLNVGAEECDNLSFVKFKTDSFKIPKNSWNLETFKIRKIRFLNLWLQLCISYRRRRHWASGATCPPNFWQQGHGGTTWIYRVTFKINFVALCRKFLSPQQHLSAPQLCRFPELVWVVHLNAQLSISWIKIKQYKIKLFSTVKYLIFTVEK